MRLFSIIAPILALLAAAAVSKPAPSQPQHRFDEFRRLSHTSPASTLQLNDASYTSLTKAPRDYSVLVILQALDPRFGCQLCRETQPEWDIVCRSWAKGDKDNKSRLLFGKLDFVDGRETFISLGLQTAPVLLLFPPTQGPHAAKSPDPLRYEFSQGPPTAETIHAWLVRHLPGRPHPPIKRPINWMRWGSAITILLGVGTAAVTVGPYVLLILQNRNLWAAGTMIAILLFISGHMFNQIRGAPYVASDGRGGVKYFANGFSSQLGLETQVVAAMYGVLSFCTVALATRVPRITKPQSQLVAGVSWVAVMFIMNSFLLSVFRIKNGGYPFSLPPFM